MEKIKLTKEIPEYRKSYEAYYQFKMDEVKIFNGYYRRKLDELLHEQRTTKKI